jgi:hypothetical protein
MLRSVAVCLVGALVASACDDSSGTVLQLYAPTLLSADPATFLGDVRCGSELRKYVVTVFDVSTGTAEKLGSSPPTDCTKPTTFGTKFGSGTTKVDRGRAYIAAIDGYDRDDITPEGGTESGLRTMLDASMTEVPPRWTTTCGEIIVAVDGEVPDTQLNPLRYPTVTLSNIEVTFQGCLPLRRAEVPDGGVVDASPDSPTDTTTPDAAEEPSEDGSSPDADGGSAGPTD